MTKSEFTDYDSVCTELDKLSIQMLDLMKEYMDCKVIIENYVKTGSLHLAKARYIMGNKSVSSLQLPGDDCDILAQTRVSHSKSFSTESLIFEIKRLSLEKDSDNEVKNSDCKSRNSNKECLTNNKPLDSESKVYNTKKKRSDRNNEKKFPEDDSDVKNRNSDQRGYSRSLTMSKDPMKWFGVLVPQNLKHAQTNFSTALDYVVQCANIQTEMNSVQSRYDDCLKLKKELS